MIRNLVVLVILGSFLVSCKKAIPINTSGDLEVVTKISGNTIYAKSMINGLTTMYISIKDSDSSVSAITIY